MSADLMQLFYSTINAKAQSTLGDTFKGTLTPVELGAQGDFPWYWQDINNNFNANTFSYISRRVIPGQHGGVALGDSLINGYADALSDLTYVLSPSDKKRLSDTQQATNVQGTSVVSSYQQSYGAITADQLTAASKVMGSVPTRLDYVIGYIVGYIWSGRSLSGGQPLSYQELYAARSLNSLLTSAPPSAQTVLTAVSAYLNVTNTILSLEDASSNAMWLKAKLLGNTQNPTDQNGGVVTIDSNGVSRTRPGYVVNKSVGLIQNSLNSQSSFQISMTAQRKDANTMSVNIDGQAAGDVQADFLTIGLSGGASFSLFQASGSGQSATIEMTFPGLTVVPLDQAEWQQDTLAGWFNYQPLALASANTDFSKTGWAFSPASPYNFSRSGDFGWLSNLIISNYPTIRITYSEGNYSDFSKTFQQNFSTSVKLFGIPLGSASESSFTGSTSSESTDGSFSITIAPPVADATVSPLDLQCFVLAAEVQYAIRSPSFQSTALKTVRMADPSSQQLKAKLGAVSFINQTGTQAEICNWINNQPNYTVLNTGQVSPALNGTLMHIDVLTRQFRYAYDLTNFLPNGLLVQDESPYKLKQILDGNTLKLYIQDVHGGYVASFNPAAVLPA